jgi:hypothetical protein
MKIPSWRRYLIPIFLIILIIISGCSQKANPDQSGGVTKLDEAGEPFRPIMLQEALSEIRGLFGEVNSVNNQTIPVYYIQGKGVSADGNGEQWIIGVKYKNDSYFVQVESNQVVLVPTTMVLPRDEINLQSVVQPGNLIMVNQRLIQETFGPDHSVIDLELMNGVYAATSGQPESARILYFNSTTGAPI